MYVRMYVCMCVRAYLCMCVGVDVDMYVYVYVCVCVCVCVCVLVYRYMYIVSLYISIYSQTLASLLAYVNSCMYTDMGLCPSEAVSFIVCKPVAQSVFRYRCK